MPVDIATFYRFVPVQDPAFLRAQLQRLCADAGLKGTVLIAAEGLNGTLGGEAVALASVMQAMRLLTGLSDLPVRMAHAELQPFLRLKIRCKPEIVTMGDRTVDPRARTGTLVAPQDWNALLADPDVLVIDTRNAFEVAAGTFPGATDPGTRSFSDFPAFVRDKLDSERSRKIAMFCTGGIRCEKASSLMLREGFEQVYQLHGGILAYLEQVPADESLWRGDCFVFDGRVAVGQRLIPAALTQCFCCRSLLTASDRASSAFEAGVSCPHCASHTGLSRKASARERQRRIVQAAARGDQHLGSGARPRRNEPDLRPGASKATQAADA